MRGIYEIHIAKCVYVGQAGVIEKRQREHLNDLNRGKHFNQHMQRVFNKYGLAEGWFRVLELVPAGEDLLPREQFWYDTRLAEIGRRRVMNQMRPEKNPMDDPTVRERNLVSIRARHADPAFQEATRRRLQAQHADPAFQEAVRAGTISANSRQFALVAPDGSIHRGINAAAFAREHGLRKSCLCMVAKGIRPHHKGWTRYEEN